MICKACNDGIGEHSLFCKRYEKAYKNSELVQIAKNIHALMLAGIIALLVMQTITTIAIIWVSK